MAVFYRYRSGVETFSVPVPTPSISVADLAHLILETSRHGQGRTRGRGPRETIALSNTTTGEEYTHGSALVPRGSTVTVRRVAGPATDTIIVEGSTQVPGSEKNEGSSSTSEEVIDAAEPDREDPSQGANCYGRVILAQKRTMPPPPHGYVCHRCRVPGHFIQHCPTNGDPRFDRGRATATPAPPPAPAPAAPRDGIPAELRCKICKKLMADAVVTRCCFYSFCDRCIRGHIAAKSKCVCGAHARADDPVPNVTLRAFISNNKIGNAVAEPAPPCPAASQDRHIPEVAAEKEEASEHSDVTGPPPPPRDIGFHDEAGGRKRTRSFANGDGAEDWRCEDRSFKRNCSSGGISQLVLT